ncbi:LuxR C-terminal-related transcriptional regulator [Xylanivirga thermophila]|uniref:LuxR C-terminal-related transcriptional regulator n=1 Tax=Xylanivirga thermophila TaxID=2496273 RepID=UPI00101DE370|nr:LuxR C-terminal-related transcriptional regulator [Xylanivirga thermophila]
MKLKELIIDSGLEYENNYSLNEECDVVIANYAYEKKLVSKYIFIYLNYSQYKKYIVDKEQYKKSIEERYLEPIFFDLVGDLSWNLYLVCVLPSEDYRKISSEELVEFEKNEKYARKLVISELYFSKLIPVGKVIIEDSIREIIDPIDEWYKELNKNGMVFCFDAYSKYKIIDFLEDKNVENGNSLDLTLNNNEENKTQTSCKIEQLKMTEQFRPHCFGLNTELGFGDVNLLFGANGSGKTSILEAIELVMTGEIRKNNTGDIDNDIYYNDLKSEITLQMEGNEIMHIPNNARERKLRESRFYQNRQGTRQKERLNKAFHQYNYYSFEDTFSFCFLGEQPNYSEEFSKIIYGESTKTIEKNWLNYKEKFEQEKASIEKEIKCIVDEVKLLEKIDSSSIQIRLEPLYNLLSEVKLCFDRVEDETNLYSVSNWLLQLNTKLTKIKMLLENFLSESGEIESIKDINDNLDRVAKDRSSLEEKVALVEKNINNIDGFISKLFDDLQQVISDDSSVSEVIEDIKKQINIFNSYILGIKDIEKCNLFLELENKKVNLKQKINVLNYFKDTWGHMANEQITDKSLGDIETLILEKSKKKCKLEKEFKNICDKIITEESKKDSIDNIIIQVKALGMRYFKERNNGTKCPLCDTDFFTKEKFLEAIDKEIEIDDSYYRKLFEEKGVIEKDLSEINIEIEYYATQQRYINMLHEALNFINDNNLLEFDTLLNNRCNDNMEQAVNEVLSLLETNLQQLRNLEHNISSMELEGYDYDFIKETLNYINSIAGTEDSKLTLETITFIKNNIEEGCNSKIIVLTIHEDKEYLIEAIKMGAKGYVMKDAEAEHLIQAVRDVSKGETYLQPTLTGKIIGDIDKTKYRDSLKKRFNDNNLTPREIEVLLLIADGKNNKEIADELYISEKTVKNHVSNIFKKIDVCDRTQAAIYAFKNHLK